MEYIDGVNIGKYISDYEFFSSEITLDELFIQLIDGFQYIEEHGIIHRDIREGSILVDKSGVAKIIDFGIGKRFEKADDIHDSLHGQINRTDSDILPQEYTEGIYTSKTDQFYLAELFNRLMREANVIKSDFSYYAILSKMAQKDPSKRYDTFAQIKDAIGKHDFSVMGISDEDKYIYQEFSNSICQSLSAFIDEQKFNHVVSVFIFQLEKALSYNTFENVIQKNADVIRSIVAGGYKYDNIVRIECKVVRRFLDWFKKCTSESQQLVINNIIHKLSVIKVVMNENDIPF